MPRRDLLSHCLQRTIKTNQNVLIISVILLDMKAVKTEMRELNVYKNQELFSFFF